MRVVNISVCSSDPRTMMKPTEDLCDEFGLNIELSCWTSEEMDDDILKYQDMVRNTRSADLVIMRCMSDPTKFGRFDDYEKVLRETNGFVLINSGSPEIKFLYRDLFKGSDQEFVLLTQYIGYRGADNDRALLLWLNKKMNGPNIPVPEPLKQRTDGIYHPDCDRNIELKEYLKRLDPGKPTAGIMFTGNLWIYDNTSHIDALIRSLESKGMNTIPVFFSSTTSSSEEKGTAEHVNNYMMDKGRSIIDVMLMLSPFSQLVNSRNAKGMGTPDDENFYKYLTDVPVIQAMTVNGKFRDYEETTVGLTKAEMMAQVSWPEVDGQIISVPIAMTDVNRTVKRYIPVEDRIEHISELAKNWAILGRTPVKDRKVVILLYQSKPESSRIGSAAGLDTLESVASILKRMKADGYTVDDVPENGKELINDILDGVTNDLEWMNSAGLREKAIGLVGKKEYIKHFETMSDFNQKNVKDKWGEPIGTVSVDSDKIVIPGIIKGNVMIGYQPLRAWFDQMDAVYHDPVMPMTHQYLEYYRWIKDVFGAQAVIHVGTHGTLEWLPGKSVGLSGKCYPDIVLNAIPHLYPYVIDDPGEGIQAKRRSEAVLIGHMCPTMTRAGGYDDLATVDTPLQEYFKFKDKASAERRNVLISQIYEAAKAAELFNDLGLPPDADVKKFSEHLPELHDYLTEVKEALIRDGLHIMGKVPEGRRMEENIYSLMRLRNGTVPSMRTALANMMGIDMDSMIDDPSGYTDGEVNSSIIERVDEAYQKLISDMLATDYDADICKKQMIKEYGKISDDLSTSLKYACTEVVPNLKRMTDEIEYLMQGLDGKYVLPGPSGAPTRGGADILPMGRNYYAVDPSLIPSRSSWNIGARMADQMIARYKEEKGTFPKEVGFIIWATDTMKTNGDDMAYILWLMGIRPIWSKTGGQVIGLEVIPLSELKRPRVDVTVRITGLFRDTFPNLIDILDDAVKIVADLDEDDEDNILAANLRRDMIESLEKGIPVDEARRRTSVRVFGCPPGAYGPGVTHAIESGDWKTVKDLADIYVTWASYGYGRGMHGDLMKDEFMKRFGKVAVTVKNMPDREIDLLDMDDVYGFLGGLNAFVRTYGDPKAMSFMGDSSDPDRVKVRQTNEEMRFVFRSKILNPKYRNGLKEHGYRGVTEIAKMTEYMLGWDATSAAIEDWMYEQVTEKFLLDEDMLEWALEENPHGVMDILDTLNEVIERELWDASDEMKEKLDMLYLKAEEAVEGIMDRR